MPTITKDFSGKLNLDVHPHRVPAGDYIDAFNITRDSQGEGQDKVVAGIIGNQIVGFTLPDGVNKVIGGFPDKLRGRYYYFVWNQNGYHTIVYYDIVTDTISKVIQNLTDSDGQTIFILNPSNKIYNVNVIHGDENLSDILCFIDSDGNPKKINIDNVLSYAPVQGSYIEVIKAPPVAPPLCVYENDNGTTFTNNNVKKSLFRFTYRYGYDDNERSVWSSQSKVPLPYEPFNTDIDNNYRNNSRISVYMNTGDKTVRYLELGAIQSKQDFISGTFLIKKIDKLELGLADNTIYRFVFYNDSVYPQVDANESVLLFDNVPQKAAAQELLNGNVLLYGNITEGYDKVELQAEVISNTLGSVFDEVPGMLFFAATDTGKLSYGDVSTKLTLFLTGYGTNDVNNNVSTLSNARATYTVKAVAQNGTNISFSYTFGSESGSVATILSNIAGQALAQGFVIDVVSTNSIVLSYPAGFFLQSSYALIDRTLTTANNANSVAYVKANTSNYSYAVTYFDRYGRTNGAFNTEGLNVTTLYQQYNGRVLQPTQRIEITSRPPEWAAYYHIACSKNLTYSKLLYWVTARTLSDWGGDPNMSAKYVWLDISNIQEYNNNESGTQNNVSYEYTPGDRIRVMARFRADGVAIVTPTYDLDILSLETNPKINGVEKAGTFLKLNIVPGGPFLQFSESADFQNYAIIIYNYAQSSSEEGRLFYEIGEQFGIGNPGTSDAIHAGNERTQSVDLSTSALVNIYSGDYFARYRTVPVGAKYSFISGDTALQDFDSTLRIRVPSTITTPSYIIKDVPYSFVDGNPADSPQWSFGNYFIWNTSTSTISVNLKGVIPFFSVANTSYRFYAKICTNSGPFLPYQEIELVPIGSITANETNSKSFDRTVQIPPNGRLFLLIDRALSDINPKPMIKSFDLFVDILKSITIPIVDINFSDSYGIKLNSFGRTSVIEENAQQVNYPTLVRFSQAYQPSTSINGTSRFFPEDLDEYDRNYGPIWRLHVRDRTMRVYQQFKVGLVPILTQIIKDVTGNPLEANSDQLINKIQYYAGDYGIGRSPSSLAWNNFFDYFVDDGRGVVCRLGNNGITPISLVDETNAFFVKNLASFRKELNNGIVPTGQVYMGDPTVYGAFDAYTNKYIVCLEEINRYSDPDTLIFSQPAYTLAYAEKETFFDSKYGYYPEWIDCLNTLLISFRNGQFWKHNSDTYCNFFGEQQEASITVAINAAGIDKKTWISVSEYSNVVWDCPEIISQLDSYGSTKQISNLVVSDFKKQEGQFNASFLRDQNSAGGIINGDALKGQYVIIKFRVQSASNFVFLNAVSVNYIDSPLNKR